MLTLKNRDLFGRKLIPAYWSTCAAILLASTLVTQARAQWVVTDQYGRVQTPDSNGYYSALQETEGGGALNFTTDITSTYPDNSPFNTDYNEYGFPFDPVPNSFSPNPYPNPFYADAYNALFGDHIGTNGMVSVHYKGDLNLLFRYTGPLIKTNLFLKSEALTYCTAGEWQPPLQDGEEQGPDTGAAVNFNDTLGNNGSASTIDTVAVTEGSVTPTPKLFSIPVAAGIGELALSVQGTEVVENFAPYSTNGWVATSAGAVYGFAVKIDDRSVAVNSSLGLTYHSSNPGGGQGTRLPDLLGGYNSIYANTALPGTKANGDAIYDNITYTAVPQGTWANGSTYNWSLALGDTFGIFESTGGSFSIPGDYPYNYSASYFASASSTPSAPGAVAAGSQEVASIRLTDGADQATETGYYYLTFHAPMENPIPKAGAMNIPAPNITPCQIVDPGPFSGVSGGGQTVVSYTFCPEDVQALTDAGYVTEIADGLFEINPGFFIVGTLLGIAGHQIQESNETNVNANFDDIFAGGLPTSITNGSGLPGNSYNPPVVATPGETAKQCAVKYYMNSVGYYQAFVTNNYNCDSFGADGYDGQGLLPLTALPPGGAHYLCGSFSYNAF